eukprot:GEMP01005202.1.p1 GENE.GEMP01005202.1~~GEMP01005202.1.p1  ORF type:complete len:1290 (+),score=141.53 GEMP01005202.1:37-3906(+)
MASRTIIIAASNLASNEGRQQQNLRKTVARPQARLPPQRWGHSTVCNASEQIAALEKLIDQKITEVHPEDEAEEDKRQEPSSPSSEPTNTKISKASQSRQVAAIESIRNASCMISPKAPWKVCWDLFVGGLIVYSVLTVPFTIAFSDTSTTDLEDEQRSFMYILDRIVDAFFISDMILCFLTGYVTSQDMVVTEVMELRKIAVRYLKSWFLIDFFSSVPFDILIMAAMNSGGTENTAKVRSLKMIRIVRLVRLTKLIRLFKLKKFTHFVEEQVWINPHVWKVSKMLFKILFIAHLLACMWRFVGVPFDEGDCVTSEGCGLGHKHVTWVVFFHVDKMDVFAQYITSFHMITASMMAVGYGDIFATNTLERLYCILVQIVGATTFGFILSAVTGLIEYSNARASERRRRFSDIAEWMSARNIPFPLQKRVTNHLRYEFEHTSMYKASDILYPLSRHLRKEVTSIYCAARIEALTAVFAKCHVGLEETIEPLVLLIVPYLKPQFLEKNDIIYEHEEPVDDIIFIVTGSVEGVEPLRKTTPGKRFMTISRFLGKRREELTMPDSRGSVPGVICFIIGPLQLMPGSLCNQSFSAMTYSATADSEIYVMPINAFLSEVTNDVITPTATINELEKGQVCRSMMLGEILLEPDMEYSGGTGEIPNEISSSYRRAKTSIIYDWKKWTLGTLPSTVATQASFTGSARRASEIARSPTAIRQTLRMVSGPNYLETTSQESSNDILRRGIAEGFWDYLDIFVDVLFFFDMCIASRTAYINQQGMLAIINVDSEDGGSSARALKLIRTLRLIRLLKLARLLKITKLSKSLQDTQLAQWVPTWCGHLVSLIGSMLFVAHLIGCFWFYIATSNTDLECNVGQLLCSKDATSKSWWEEKNIHKKDHLAQYVASLYWAFSTMTTVGYGDIVPMSTSSRIYAIVAQLFGATMFGYVIGSVAGAAGRARGSEQLIRRQLMSITEFGEENQLPATMISKMRRGTRIYLDSRTPFSEDQFLDNLPHCLRARCVLIIHQETMKLFPMFRRQPNWIKCLLARSMEPIGVDAGYPVLTGGEYLYFVKTGSFEAGDLEFVFTDGMMFGFEDGFIQREDVIQAMASVRACPLQLPMDQSCCMAFALHKSMFTSPPQDPQLSNELTSLVASVLIDQYKRDIPKLEAQKRRELLDAFHVTAYEAKIHPAIDVENVNDNGPLRAFAVVEHEEKSKRKTMKLEISIASNSTISESQLETKIRELLQEVLHKDTQPSVSFQPPISKAPLAVPSPIPSTLPSPRQALPSGSQGIIGLPHAT